jgi:N-acyl-D-aspartate/D-glutamate deacylase
MYDTIIRGGTIVDGTGAPGRTGDVAIKDGLIAAVGKVDGEARETIDADGALVTPGFIDIHTHYDGQFLWDDRLDPSFSNGVTTAIAGNCGVGFAPVRPEHRRQLIELMEGVEDIPGIVIEEGLDWDWTSFPDYLDRLGAREYTIDVAAHLPHAPLRVFVMGERALRHQPATDADIAEMSRLVIEAMEAGAIGVSGSRILEHRTVNNDYVPGTFAEDRELLALATAMGKTGKGTFQIVPLGGGADFLGTPATNAQRHAEHERFIALAKASGRPLTYFTHQFNHAPEEWRELYEDTAKAQAAGLPIYPQTAARGFTLLMSLDGYHPFRTRPSYLAIAHLPRNERAAAMREPARRTAILGESNVAVGDAPTPLIWYWTERVSAILDRYFVMRPPVDHEPDDSQRIRAIAAATGQSIWEVAYDLFSEGDGSNLAADYSMNYTYGNLEAVREMLSDPNTVSGLNDGGAHLQIICDAASPTFQLAFWGRDRKRGARLPIELLVHKMTGKAATVYGLGDRGVIAPGRRADLNVIDFDRLDTDIPRMAFDLPLGGPRMLQASTGYLATLVNGTVTRRNDQETGTRPGRLVRSRA